MPDLSTPSVICGAKRLHFRGADFAADERAKADFKFHGAGAQARLAAVRAHLDVAQLDMRRRQNAGVDRPIDTDVQAAESASLFLERRAIVAPIDDEWGDQRGYKHQNNGDGDPEQRRLHGKVSLVILKKTARAPAPKPRTSSSRMHAVGAATSDICGRFCVGPSA